MAPGELVTNHEADAMSGASVVTPGVPEAGNQQVERRGGLASTKQPHEDLPLGVCGLALARRVGIRLDGFVGGTFRLALGWNLALGELLLGYLFLGLLRLQRRRDDARDRRLRVIKVRHVFDRGQIAHTDVVADVERCYVELDPLRDVHRKRLDVDLPQRLLQHAALGDPLRLSGELDDHLRVDRLIEPNLLEVNVEEAVLHGVKLVLLEHGVVGLLGALDDDVDDRVEAVGAGEDPAELPLADAERLRGLPAPVENAGNCPFGAQTAGSRASTVLPRLHFELDTFTSHTGSPV